MVEEGKREIYITHAHVVLNEPVLFSRAAAPMQLVRVKESVRLSLSNLFALVQRCS